MERTSILDIVGGRCEYTNSVLSWFDARLDRLEDRYEEQEEVQYLRNKASAKGKARKQRSR